MRRFLLLLPLLLFLSARPAAAQNIAVNGFCTNGAQSVLLSGLQSSNQFYAIYPGCTVTVNTTGDGTATIFSSAAGAPLSNPFTASSPTGSWTFYIAANSTVDVVMSGFPAGVTPTTFTIPAISVNTSGGGGGSITLLVNGTTASSQTRQNLISGANGTVTDGGGGNITINAVPTVSSPATPCLQYSNSGAFGCASGLTTPDGKQLRTHGPDPLWDITDPAFGARATNGSAASTVTCTSGNAQVTVGSTGYLTGDGVTLQGCGATVSMSTPSAPTLTPVFAAGAIRDHLTVNSPAGSSSYVACIVAEDINQGLTPCSSSTTITNGPATLGLLTATITSQSLSNDTLTTNYSGGATIANNAMVQVAGAVARFTGEMKITTASAGSFTVANYVYDARATQANLNDAPNSVTGSGTINYYQGIKVTYPNVTGTRRYWLCMQRPGDSQLHVIAQSDTQQNSGGWQATQIEDWGSTYLANQSFPYYITDSICTGSGQNDALTTTIASGGGTLTPTLTATPSNNSSSTKIELDAAPAIAAAFSAASNGQGCVFIPPQSSVLNTFQIFSYLSLTAGGCVIQSGAVTANDTIELKNVNWYGQNGSAAPQFGFSKGASVVSSTANPTFHLEGGGGNYISNVNFTSTANGATIVAVNNSQTILHGVNCILSSTSDSLGMCVQYHNTTGTISGQIIDGGGSFSSGIAQTVGLSWTPLIDMPFGQDGSGNPQLSGIKLDISDMSNNRRSISFVSGFSVTLTRYYIQGPIMPTVLFTPTGGGNFPIALDVSLNDTSGEPIVADVGPGANIFMHKVIIGSSTNPIISGTRPATAVIDGYFYSGLAAPANRQAENCAVNNAIAAPYDSPTVNAVAERVCEEANVHLMMSGYPLVWPLPQPTGVTAGTASAGGSMPSGTFTYAVSATGFDGGETIPSIPSSNTVTTSGTCPGSGNCSNTVTWTGTPGAATYNVWRCASSCGNGFFTTGTWLRIATHVAATSFNDTVGTSAVTGFPVTTTTGISETNALETEALQLVIPEATAPTAVANFDQCYADSTAHAIECAFNGGSFGQISLLSAAQTWTALQTFGAGIAISANQAVTWNEGTAPSAAAGKDICYGDSTAHALLCSYNNGTFYGIPLIGLNNTWTAPQTFSTGVAGFVDWGQGSSPTSTAPCNASTSVCEYVPTSVTSYFVVKPGAVGQGIETNAVASSTDTQGWSGDSNHSTTVTTSSGTSVGATNLCTSTNCPAGTYDVHVYIDITTACATGGTYIVNLTYTDDQASKTVPMNIQGAGTTPSTGSLALNTVTNFGQAVQTLRLTSGNLQYSTTAGACGSGGPMVGKLYLAANPVM